jgi:DNA-binding transcriptional LysR family regulator
MELRQLRYFVAVAEELHYGRAAARIHISGPALSQQIIALERDLGAELFIRDRRGVQLTEAGRSLVEDARGILALADEAKQRVRRTAADTTPLRLGYVSWLPDDITALISTMPVRIDEWVLPSHAQADRVAEGSLDLTFAWIDRRTAQTQGLAVHLAYAEPLARASAGCSRAGPRGGRHRVGGPAHGDVVVVECLRTRIRRGHRSAYTRDRRRRHHRRGVLRTRAPPACTGPRVTEATHLRDPTHVEPVTRNRPGTTVDVVASAPRR